jgi:methylsterol monooxygenase/4-alpha-methyl-delta7-sterol-4alpha-methyl oxidase
MEQFSNPSTACSTPTNDSVEKVIKNDSVRYRRKGYGLISAILIAFSFLYLFPKLFEAILPHLNARFSKEELHLTLGIGFHSGIYLLANIIMYAIYVAKNEFFERYRVLTNPWPWESNPEQWKVMLKKSINATLFAHFVIMPVLLGADCLLGVQFRFDLESFPDYFEIISQIVFFMICEDFLFYWCHRMLHHPKIYPYIHKRHHEYNITVSISSEYAHPLEFIFGNAIPYAAGSKILGSQVHIVTYIMWGIVRVMETVDGHSGYEFSWSPYRLLPLSGSSSYHNFHHLQNVGNYCSFFTLWDTLCGTNKSYFKHLAKKQKQEIASRIKGDYDKMIEKQRNDANAIKAREIENENEMKDNLVPTKKVTFDEKCFDGNKEKLE